VGQPIAVRVAWERVASRRGANLLRPFLQRVGLLLASRPSSIVRFRSIAVLTKDDASQMTHNRLAVELQVVGIELSCFDGGKIASMAPRSAVLED
jgi:hypothetical protein